MPFAYVYIRKGNYNRMVVLVLYLYFCKIKTDKQTNIKHKRFNLLLNKPELSHLTLFTVIITVFVIMTKIKFWMNLARCTRFSYNTQA